MADYMGKDSKTIDRERQLAEMRFWNIMSRVGAHGSIRLEKHFDSRTNKMTSIFKLLIWAETLSNMEWETCSRRALGRARIIEFSC